MRSPLPWRSQAAGAQPSLHTQLTNLNRCSTPHPAGGGGPPTGGGPPAGGGYPNAGTPAFADTPGTVNPQAGYGGPGGAGYAPSPAGYAPSPGGYAPAAGTPALAGTPGMYAPAGTPGMYAPAGTPGVGGYGDGMSAPTPGGGGYGGAPPPPPPGASHEHWVGVEVQLPGGERCAVRSVEGGAATVAVGREEGGRWAYPPDAPARTVPVGDLTLVKPERKDAVRVVAGELAGQYGELLGLDVGDAIVKLGTDIKILPTSEVGRLAEQPAAAEQPPPPPPA